MFQENITRGSYMPSRKVSPVPLGVVKRSTWFTYELPDQMEKCAHEKEVIASKGKYDPEKM